MDLRLLAQGPALRIIFFGHLVPTVWALQGDLGLHSSYVLYNALFFVGLLWCLHSPESEEAIMMTTFMDLSYILLDAITIGIFTSNKPFSFSVLMLVINLLLRPLTSLVLLRFYNERSGRYNTLGIPVFSNYGAGIGSSAPGPSHGPAYQDIDRPYQTVPTQIGDTGSPIRTSNSQGFTGE